jgi:hypothetical protein
MKVTPQVRAFDLKSVRLLDGPFQHAMEIVHLWGMPSRVTELLDLARRNNQMCFSAGR